MIGEETKEGGAMKGMSEGHLQDIQSTKIIVTDHEIEMTATIEETKIDMIEMTGTQVEEMIDTITMIEMIEEDLEIEIQTKRIKDTKIPVNVEKETIEEMIEDLKIIMDIEAGGQDQDRKERRDQIRKIGSKTLKSVER